MPKIQIDDERIPVPENRRGADRVYPFGELGVLESFYSPDAKISSVRASAYYFEKKNPGFKFRVAKSEGGVRVWRLT